MENGHNQKVGRRGEDSACAWLESRGHTILCRNWRAGHLELDIVSLKDGALHFVEVKSRSELAEFEPENNVTREKRRRLERAASAFMHSEQEMSGRLASEVFFDVLAVVEEDSGCRIEYYPEAFFPLHL
ncbi:MAG: YraN family protein [Bacteroidales bacterium]|nr:YraN family protein [Bacteroidales bacterium]